MPRNFYVFRIALNKMSRRFALAVIEPMNDEDQILIAGEIARLSRQTVEPSTKLRNPKGTPNTTTTWSVGLNPSPKSCHDETSS
jgi:hypothetical protein